MNRAKQLLNEPKNFFKKYKKIFGYIKYYSYLYSVNLK